MDPFLESLGIPGVFIVPCLESLGLPIVPFLESQGISRGWLGLLSFLFGILMRFPIDLRRLFLDFLRATVVLRIGEPSGFPRDTAGRFLTSLIAWDGM